MKTFKTMEMDGTSCIREYHEYLVTLDAVYGEEHAFESQRMMQTGT